VELNFVPDTLHGIGSSIKQTGVSNDSTRKNDNVAKTTVIVVVLIIVIILRIIIIIIIIIVIVIVVNYTRKLSSLISLP
jgi:lipopolysaccharide/colanic/teichoic acid biosynthesis glycosyltransferase